MQRRPVRAVHVSGGRHANGCMSVPVTRDPISEQVFYFWKAANSQLERKKKTVWEVTGEEERKAGQMERLVV